MRGRTEGLLLEYRGEGVGMIAKPFTMDRLLDRIREMLDPAQVFRPVSAVMGILEPKPLSSGHRRRMQPRPKTRGAAEERANR